VTTPPEAVVGIAGVDFQGGPDARVRLRLQLADGSIATCYWPVAELVDYMRIIPASTRTSNGATVN